jgi:translation elongation factor EF-G
MTGGRGRFTAKPSHYDPVPSHLVDKIVTSTKETEKVH